MVKGIHGSGETASGREHETPGGQFGSEGTSETE